MKNRPDVTVASLSEMNGKGPVVFGKTTIIVPTGTDPSCLCGALRARLTDLIPGLSDLKEGVTPADLITVENQTITIQTPARNSQVIALSQAFSEVANSIIPDVDIQHHNII